MSAETNSPEFLRWFADEQARRGPNPNPKPVEWALGIEKQNEVLRQAQDVFQRTEDLFTKHFGNLPLEAALPDIPQIFEGQHGSLRVEKKGRQVDGNNHWDAAYVFTHIAGDDKTHMFISTRNGASNKDRAMIWDPWEMVGLNQVLSSLEAALTPVTA